MRRYAIRPMIRTASRRGWRPSAGLLLLGFVAVFLSLGSVISTYAMPAEARLSETWYAYRQELKFDFTAEVHPGNIYANKLVTSGDLLQVRLPVEPPVFRRVLVSKLTDSVKLKFPYTYTADRPASLTAQYSVDGTLTVPGLWQRPYPLLAAQELHVDGDQIALENLAVEIPVKQIVAELEKLTQEMKLPQDQAEIRIRPNITVTVDGQKEPVVAESRHEVVIAIRGTATALEVDEPKLFKDDQQFTESKVLPATVSLLGYEWELAAVRRLSVTALSVFALLLAGLFLVQWWRGRTKDEDLKKLGPALIVARGLDLPSDSTMVDVRTVQQLIQIHMQTERPVIRVGPTCYLLDGATCYRLDVGETEPSDETA